MAELGDQTGSLSPDESPALGGAEGQASANIIPPGINYYKAGADGYVELDDLRLDEETIDGDITLQKVRVLGDVSLNGTVLEGRLLLKDVKINGSISLVTSVFKSSVQLEDVTVDGNGSFEESVYQGLLELNRIKFNGSASFGMSQFDLPIALIDVSIGGDGSFVESRYEREVLLRTVKFGGDASFEESFFRAPINFRNVTVGKTVSFEFVIFEKSADLQQFLSEGEAKYGGALFKDRVAVGDAEFKNGIDLTDTVFQKSLDFRARVRGEGKLDRTRIEDVASFQQARFEGETTLVISPDVVQLNDVSFKQRPQIEVHARQLVCRRAQFANGVYLRLHKTDATLDDTDFSGPSIVTAVPREQRPKVSSVRRANVEGLTLSGVDLRTCLFLGAHKLDELRTESAIFSATPRGLRWTSRQVLAEEVIWRTDRGQWKSSDVSSFKWLDPPERPDAGQISGIYRALRKGREDNKDEPGAADFYYGEMEMRRQAKREEAGQAERLATRVSSGTEYGIILLYWLSSGYALRAWRATITLILAFLVFVGLFMSVGFERQTAPTARRNLSQATTTTATTLPSTSPIVVVLPPTTTTSPKNSLGRTVAFSARTMVGLSREPQPKLTVLGEILQVSLRILAPLFLGLIILSIRGRVKR